MAEYISREEAIKGLREVYEYEYPTASGDFDEYASHDVPNVLRNIPAADVQPVKYGTWENTNTPNHLRCSNCEITHFIAQYPHGAINYCPNCGADMRGDTQ